MKFFVSLGAFFCFIGVVSGALSSHAIRELLIRMGGFNNFELATRYMFYHGLGTIAVGMLKSRFPAAPFQIAGGLFIAGTLLFQGNLYLISTTGIRALQMLTPVGGVCLMAGWMVLAVLAWRIKIDPGNNHRFGS